ncbi:MAG: RdgB/HAM1 family non-canonical purine NTP pyrophosphatase [Firmicutes bacterium]|nr:RdgB/HAM1 family non-canonical purine NTP pyrophosphatase [Bacillota bacterium]
MDKTIVLSTHNKGKLAEFEGIASRLGFKIITRDEAGIPHEFDVVEDGTTFEENSYKKAYEVMKMCGLPTMADDSGLMVDALDGQPGVYSSRFGGVEGDSKRNYTKLLGMMEGLPLEERKAHFTTVITLIYPGGETIVAKGECHGHIATEPKGEKGFGYDPVFIPDGYTETFGIMGPEVKNLISHRARALEELERILEERENK